MPMPLRLSIQDLILIIIIVIIINKIIKSNQIFQAYTLVTVHVYPVSELLGISDVTYIMAEWEF